MYHSHTFLLPNSSSILQEMEGFTYSTAIDLNMGYYTIRLDPDIQKICTIILPWGKYSYLHLPTGISWAPDIVQEKMSKLVRTLEYVRTYIDDLIVITMGTYDDHLDKAKVVSDFLQLVKVWVNIKESTFTLHKINF